MLQVLQMVNLMGIGKAVGVDGRMTAKKYNQTTARLNKEQHNSETYDDSVESGANKRFVEFTRIRTGLDLLDEAKQMLSGWGLYIAFLFFLGLGILVGFSLGQNSILSQFLNNSFGPILADFSRMWLR